MKYYTAVIKWKTPQNITSFKRGWGNGYVLVPKHSLLSGIHYDDRIIKDEDLIKVGNIKVLNDNVYCDTQRLLDYNIVHHGITWSNLFGQLDCDRVEWIGEQPPKEEVMDMWCFGFDTAHYNDTIERCPKDFVIKETLRLKGNLLKLEESLITNK